MRSHPIQLLRMTGFIDGISLLLLLGVAMPLKYIWGFDEMVSVVGRIHGGIFVTYALAILYAIFRVKWSLLWPIASLAAAFIPFGNFILDIKLKKALNKYAVKPINYSIIVYSIVFFSFFDLFAQLPVMSTFAASVGASAFVVGFVVGLYSLTNTLGNVLSGILTDKIGPFRILLIGLFLTSCSLLLYQFIESSPLLVMVRILHGFVAGLIVPAAFTFSANATSQNHQGRKVAFTGTFVGLAAIIGPAFSGIMASKTSVPFVFNCIAIVGFALTIMSALFLRKYRLIAKPQMNVAIPVKGLFFRSKALKAYIGAFFLMFSQGVIAYLLPLHVQLLGYDSKLSGTLLSTFGIVAVLIFALPTNRIFDRVAPTITMAIGMGLMGISQLFISQSTTTAALYSVMALYGVGFALLFPSINTILIKATPPELRGKAYGYFYAFFSLGVVVSSMLIGALSFSIVEGFLFTGAVLLVVALFSFFEK